MSTSGSYAILFRSWLLSFSSCIPSLTSVSLSATDMTRMRSPSHAQVRELTLSNPRKASSHRDVLDIDADVALDAVVHDYILVYGPGQGTQDHDQIGIVHSNVHLLL